MSDFDYRKETDQEGGDEVFSQAVRAGRRTYFFDVKATKQDDYYLTITESRKKTTREGDFTYEKHKLFLYKEDFKKFAEGLECVVDYVKKHKPEFFEQEAAAERSSQTDAEFDAL